MKTFPGKNLKVKRLFLPGLFVFPCFKTDGCRSHNMLAISTSAIKAAPGEKGGQGLLLPGCS